MLGYCLVKNIKKCYNRVKFLGIIIVIVSLLILWLKYYINKSEF